MGEHDEQAVSILKARFPGPPSTQDQPYFTHSNRKKSSVPITLSGRNGSNAIKMVPLKA